ncbi:hypothetical protein F8388_008141, partial [Cannabis sativa]
EEEEETSLVQVQEKEEEFSWSEEDEDDEEEEELGNGKLSTEELNKKFDEFIRRMKEELRIEAQQHLIMEFSTSSLVILMNLLVYNYDDDDDTFTSNDLDCAKA